MDLTVKFATTETENWFTFIATETAPTSALCAISHTTHRTGGEAALLRRLGSIWQPG